MEQLDPIEKMFMFQGWLDDQEKEMELAKNHAYIVGSFINPEAVKQLMGDSGNTHKSTDEDLERSMEMVERSIKGESKPTRHRRRRIVDG